MHALDITHLTTTPAMDSSPEPYVSFRPFIESGKATIPQLYEWHARENPTHQIFRYWNGQTTRGIPHVEMNESITRAARLVNNLAGPSTHNQHVIAILANAGPS